MVTFTPTVEIFVDSAWLDITRLDDHTKVVGPVQIVRGRSDEEASVTPTQVTFQYQDDNATLDWENPASTYYRKIGVGTPLRVKMDGTVRALVEITSVEPQWDELNDLVMVSMTASGPLRRLDDSGRALQSPAFRSIMNPGYDSVRVAYIPLEEDSDQSANLTGTYFSSVYVPDRDRILSFSIDGAADFDLGATASTAAKSLGQFGSFDTFLTLDIDSTAFTTEHFVGALVRFPDAGLLNEAIIYRFYFTGGNVDFVDLVHTTGYVLSLRAYANTFSGPTLLDTLATGNFTAYLSESEPFLIVTFEQSGADVSVRIRTTTGSGSVVGITDTLAGKTIGTMWRIIVATGSGCADMGFGQFVVANDINAFENFTDDQDTSSSYAVTGALAYDSETAGNRLSRLAEEEDVAFVGTGLDSAFRMGTQGADKLVDLMQECQDVDLGILFEDRTTFALAYQTRAGLHNKLPSATLTYQHLSPGFRPVGDDLRLTNDVTFTYEEWFTGRYAIPDDDWFHWSTQDPPDGAGVRPKDFSANVYGVFGPNGHPAWHAHIGSWREKRFPSVAYELARDVFTSDDRTNVKAVDVGSIIYQGTSGSPAWVPSNQVRLLVQGYTETLSKFEHTIVFNTTPADIYEVEVVDATTVLANVIDADDTSVKLAITDNSPPWSTTDEPYYIQIAGDAMTVTTITTDTPAYIATGAASHGDNASLVPALPAGITPDVGQLLVILANGRGNNVPTPQLPSGWTSIFSSGEMQLFGRYYKTGDAAPTVTFVGGNPGDTTSAQMAAFSGLSMNLDVNVPGNYANGYVVQSNGSTVNIAYPAYLNRRTNSAMLILGSRRDDWTSVATIAGTTEVGDTSSTSGGDAGIVWDFYNPGTPTTVAAGSFVVTGGGAADTKGAVVGLRPLQTATVTRNINGVATSHTIGSAVHVWRPGVNGL